MPIRGETGLGYVLDRDFDMPPLMLTPDELEAVMLGAQWIASKGDPVLAKAARDLVAKIATAVPERLLPFLLQPSIGAPPSRARAADGIDLARTRRWIREGRKIRIRYRDEQGRESERTVWPVMVGYAETVRLLAAWCEKREGFRHFRLDRILAADFLQDRIGRHGQLRADWKRYMEIERGVRVP